MKRTIFFIMVISLLLLFTAETQTAEKLSDRITLLERAKLETMPPKEIAAEIAKSSTKSKDGGYLANRKAIDCFSAYSCRYTGGRYQDEEITFRLRVPTGMNSAEKGKSAKKYPLIISFHGVGESNNDNRRQLSHLHYSLNLFIGPESLDCFVLVPRCPTDNIHWANSIQVKDGKGDSPMEYTKEILEELIKIYPIDTNRISCFGLCSGAVACWEMASRWPELFAAFAPVAGGYNMEKAEQLKKIPVCAFHGDQDSVIPYSCSKEIIDSLKNRENEHARLKTYYGAGHGIVVDVYRNSELYQWFLQQKKEK